MVCKCALLQSFYILFHLANCITYFDNEYSAGILGFVKIGMGYAQMSENAIALYDPLWATIQQGCSVICCCAPIYKPLIPALGLFSRLKSLSGRAFSRRNGSSSAMQVDKLPLGSLQVDATNWEHEHPVDQQVVYPERAATKEYSPYSEYEQYHGAREEV